MPEIIDFKTPDGVKIVGDWYPSPTTIGVVILLHMMTNDRKSWAPFQQELVKNNIASLAIDLRGHGESVETKEGNKLDHKKFTDEEHQRYLVDAASAVQWLEAKKYSQDRMMVMGASIGSNIAIWMLEERPRLNGAVLLSPGNYRGIDAVEQADACKYHHALWAAGSDSDDPEAYDTAKSVIERAPAYRKVFKPYKNSGHGIHLFTSDPKLMNELAVWIRESLQATPS
ncbi:MAG: alpha/beta hydrolase [Patescibacteria group bacterium]